MLRGDAPLWAALLPVAAFEGAALWLSTIPADPDYWWHLATGRWMLDHARIPTSDPFSFSRAGQNWYAHEWLGELLIGAADRIAGYAACIALTSAFFALACWLTWRSARWYGVSAREAALFTIGGGIFLLRYVEVRPQVWTWPLFALLVHELIAYDLGRRRRLWHVPVLFVLWVNVHLSALIGLAVLGLYVLIAALRWLNARRTCGAAVQAASRGSDARKHPPLRGEKQTRAALLHVTGVGVLSFLALSVNPRGPALVWFSRLYLDQNAVYYRYISEWQRLSFSGFDRITYLVGGLLVALTVVAIWRRRSLWPALLALAFACAAARAVRYVPLFALAGVPAAGWLAGSRRGRTQAPAAVPVQRGFALALAGTAAAALLILAPALPGTQFRRAARGGPGGFPAGAAAWLKTNLPDAKLFNDYDWGGYLLNALYPGRHVYIDGRTEMYGEQFFDRFVQAVDARPGWQETLAGSGADAVLLKPADPLAGALAADPSWRLAFADDVSAIYVRTP